MRVENVEGILRISIDVNRVNLGKSESPGKGNKFSLFS